MTTIKRYKNCLAAAFILGTHDEVLDHGDQDEADSEADDPPGYLLSSFALTLEDVENHHHQGHESAETKDDLKQLDEGLDELLELVLGFSEDLNTEVVTLCGGDVAAREGAHGSTERDTHPGCTFLNELFHKFNS